MVIHFSKIEKFDFPVEVFKKNLERIFLGLSAPSASALFFSERECNFATERERKISERVHKYEHISFYF